MFHVIPERVAGEQVADRLRRAERDRLARLARPRNQRAHRREVERVRASVLLVPDADASREA
jgi:hypothetical protein